MGAVLDVIEPDFGCAHEEVIIVEARLDNDVATEAQKGYEEIWRALLYSNLTYLSRV